MTEVRACLLGCRAVDDAAFRAAPGRLSCDRCAEKLAGVLADIALVYMTLTDIEELIPGGTADGGRSVPGPRSPAVDAILVHTDLRSSGNDHPAALASIASWARLVREERHAAVPAGRTTMTRELSTLRFHWDWLLGQSWVPDFAVEMRDVLAALKIVGRMSPPVLRIGSCPKQIFELVLDGEAIPLLCGATLRVRVGDEEIKCRNCGEIWSRPRWSELGDGRTDYARLSIELSVPVGTLKRWGHEDGWRISGTHGRRLVSRVDAEVSYRRRRGAPPLEQAG